MGYIKKQNTSSDTNAKEYIDNEINKINEQLDAKVDFTDLDSKVWSMSNMGQDVKEAMTGGSIAIVGDNSVGLSQFTTTIQDDIGEWKEQEVNLVEGTGYDPSTGKPSSSLDSRTVSFELNATSGDRFKISAFTHGGDTYAIMFIDGNDNLIGKAGTELPWSTPIGYEFTCPTGTTKIRMNSWTNNAKKIVEKLIYSPIATKKELEDIKNIDTIPSFYENHVNEKIKTIKELENDYGSQGETIAFITDIHYPNNNMYSFYILKKLIEETNLSYVICGGDNIRDNADLSIGKQNAYDFMKIVKKTVGDKFITVYGNHDNNNNQTSTLTGDEVYSTYFKHQENIVKPDMNKLNGLYWYLDNPIQKIRYIGLNTFEETEGVLSVAQMKWLCEVALVLPSDGWNLAFFTHKPISPLITGALGEFRQIIRAIRYQSKYSASYTDYNQETYNINVNYADKKHSVLFVATGHNHYDKLDVDNDIAYFISTCDGLYKDNESVPDRTGINMQSFDIITINKKTNTINLTKIGAGSDRSFTFSNNS